MVVTRHSTLPSSHLPSSDCFFNPRHCHKYDAILHMIHSDCHYKQFQLSLTFTFTYALTMLSSSSSKRQNLTSRTVTFNSTKMANSKTARNRRHVMPCLGSANKKENATKSAKEN